MKIAVLADIHSNLLALEAVLADLGGRKPDVVVDLGDCVSGPLWPRETMERLEALGALTVKGNHEAQLTDLFPDTMGESDRFAYDRLTAEQLARLRALPEILWVAPGVLACHGTPSDNNSFLLDVIADERVNRAPPLDIAERLGKTAARVVLCGHSHRPDMVRMPNGTLIVNPGSVGCPAFEADGIIGSESGTPHARYAVITLEDGREPAVEFIALGYDHERAAVLAEANGRPDWAHALRTGLTRRSTAARIP